ESNHDDVLYEMLKSLMKSGMAGKIIVSSNITINPQELKMTSMLHPEQKSVSFSNLVMILSPLSASILHLSMTLKHFINATK
ncbi:MAG: hypothetical protein WBX81_06405, partial [Nitrososphaeraceae archaeon]